jgi:hypothetical protein
LFFDANKQNIMYPEWKRFIRIPVLLKYINI